MKNYYLVQGGDVYGNALQALVPFGEAPEAVFAAVFGDEWDALAPLVTVATVYAATLRAAFGDQVAELALREAACGRGL